MHASEKRGMSGLVRAWCLVPVMAMLLANFAFAAEIGWIGASGGNWADGANWEGGSAPGATDTAVFALESDTRVILAANATAAKVAVTGARLDLYSGTGKTLTLGGDAPELTIDVEARVRVSGVRLASAAKVSKTGPGKLVVVGRAASDIDLDYAEGELLLEDEFGKTVTVAENDGLWAYDGISNTGTVRQHSPYAGTDGVYVGSVNGSCVTVTARREPIRVNGKFRISGDVLMKGSGSHGFAVVLHNDPRGYLARTACQQERWLGYAADDAEKGAIRKSFAIGVLNHCSMGDGRVVWGWDGEWKNPSGNGGELTDPFVYTSPCGENSATEVHPRRFKLQLEFDQVHKTAILTLVQDQSEIVQGGGVTVTWTKTLTGIDLTTLCEGDTATLAFTTDAGGRNTEVTVSNLKVEYFKTEQHIKQVIPVISSEGLWDSLCFDSNGVESKGLVYGSLEGSIHAGANAGSKGSVTARKEKVCVKGKFQISGKVTDSGTGAWGWALVLHNDPRGCMAHAAQAGNSGEAFSGTSKIDKSYAFRVVNYVGNKGQVADGKNGAWNSAHTTDPLILTNPYDGTQLVAGGAKYDFTALFDERAKTMVLTLSQDQGGTTVTATETFTDVDVPTLVGGESAWLSLTSDAGGRTTSATIDNFKIEYLAYDDEIGDYSFFRSLETSGLRPVITAASGDSDFVADLGELTVGCGTLQLGSLREMIKVIPAENLWTNCCFDADGVESQGRVYGERDGSVCAGANASNNGTVTARREKVDVKGRFQISGKVTDSGTGAWGWALVLHNDPRGCMAHAAQAGNSGEAFSGTSKIDKSYAFRVVNYVGNKGQVADGKNGVWNSAHTTDPLILTNPYDGTQLVVGGAKYDFTALFDERAKTMVLTLSQDQGGTTVTATETFTDVDVPTLVGGESAWLSLTSDAGGRTTNVTIDDFTIEYLEDGKGKSAFGCQGAAVVADGVELVLGNAAFSVTDAEQLYGFKALRLGEDSGLSVSEGMKALVKSVYVSGKKIRRGVYTASDCDWIDGEGAVEVAGRGLMLLVK